MHELTPESAEKMVSEIQGWFVTGNTLSKTFNFEDFDESMDFLNVVRPLADQIQHHPDVYISYDRVTFELTTHKTGTLTDMDVELAKKIEEAFLKFKSNPAGKQ
jgi:4a-hydroxytetrahydrobiopterin dehydratase